MDYSATQVSGQQSPAQQIPGEQVPGQQVDDIEVTGVPPETKIPVNPSHEEPGGMAGTEENASVGPSRSPPPEPETSVGLEQNQPPVKDMMQPPEVEAETSMLEHQSSVMETRFPEPQPNVAQATEAESPPSLLGLVFVRRPTEEHKATREPKEGATEIPHYSSGMTRHQTEYGAESSRPRQAFMSDSTAFISMHKALDQLEEELRAYETAMAAGESKLKKAEGGFP